MKLKHFLLTALLLFLGVGGVYAGRHYVGFASVPASYTQHSNGALASVLTTTASGGDTVFVAVGLYIAVNAEFRVPANVTLIGGYAKGDVGATTRQYPGQFVPFGSSIVDTTKFTILDGNSYKSTVPANKHRVVKVELNGVVDGCLIRNGHIRNGNGGGVLLDGGKLYNSIVRGNVAMSKPDTSIESLGGGVFIQNNGELINCLVAYNMANDGYGVAAGTGGGKMINNTITANTYAPVFAKISGNTGQPFRMYKGSSAIKYHPDTEIPKFGTDITLSEFYISRTLTTEGQYAVFCAAMDITPSGTYGQLDISVLGELPGPPLAFGTGTVHNYYDYGNNFTGMQNLLQINTSEYDPGLRSDDGVWHPHLDTASVEYPMGWVSWWGGLAYSVWLGGGLPTEAQWEYAARRNLDGSVSENLYSGAYGTTSIFEIDSWRVLDTIAWVHNTKSIDTTAANFGNLGPTWTNRAHEVARKRPNAMGIYDMTGSVNEWVADWANYTMDANPFVNSPKTDPINSGRYSTLGHMARGGSWAANSVEMFALPYRYNTNTDNPAQYIGFRPIVAF